MSVTLEEKEDVISLLKLSLRRLCGGGISSPSKLNQQDKDEIRSSSKKSNGNGSNNDNSLWKQKLETLAIKSVSFTNGKRSNKTNGDALKKSRDECPPDDDNFGKGHDIEIRIALTLFHQYSSRYMGKKQKRIKANGKFLEKKRRIQDGDTNNVSLEVLGGEMIESACHKQNCSIEIVSDLGLVRRIDSSYELSTLLVKDMEDQLWQQRANESSSRRVEQDGNAETNVMMIQTNNSGIICIVTKRRFKYLLSFDRYPCSHCIKWCKGQKGLWWHEQISHGLNHSAAATVAATTSSSSDRDNTAIVVYNENTFNFVEKFQQGNMWNEIKDDEIPVDPFVDTVRNGDFGLFLQQIQLKKYDPKSYLDRNGASVLHWASGCGNLEMIKYLIEECHCPPDQFQKGKRSFHGRTPLHWAARNGHLDVVKYLVQECDIDIDAKTIDGTPAFCWASWQGHLPIMR